MLSCHKMEYGEIRRIFFFFSTQCIFLQRHCSKTMLDFIHIIHLSYETMSYFIHCTWHLVHAIIPYHHHTTNRTILNATSEWDLFPNILIKHILDTPTQYKWNPVQSGLLNFANNKLKMVKSPAERASPLAERRHRARGCWEIIWKSLLLYNKSQGAWARFLNH